VRHDLDVTSEDAKLVMVYLEQLSRATLKDMAHELGLLVRDLGEVVDGRLILSPKAAARVIRNATRRTY